jgi:hypothetical protein
VTQRTSEIRNSEIALSLEDTETVLLMPSTSAQIREERSEESRNGWKDFPITHVKFIEHHALFQNVDALTIVLVEISGMMHWIFSGLSLSLTLDTHRSF